MDPTTDPLQRPVPERPAARSLADAQEALRRLVAAHAAGEIDAERLAAERSRIEREIGQWLLEPATRLGGDAPSAVPARPSSRLLGGLGVAVLAVAFAGYAWKGSPALAGLRAAPEPTVATAALPPDQAASGAGTDNLQQIAQMVDQLAARMKERPDDGEGWTMLGRAYTVLGRFAEAIPAYRRAIELQPSNAALLADYADALIAGNGGHETEEARAVLARALALDPRHPKTLALAGTIAFDRADYAAAIALWQKLADGLPPQSEMVQQVEASIAEARARAAAPLAAAASGADADAGTGAGTANANATDGATASRSGAAPMTTAGPPVSGTVSLAPEIAHLAAPGDTVFVFARAATGSRMPLAVRRARVADLPLDFSLDDSMAMRPDMPLSTAGQLIVGARVSKSGNATPQPGDLAGETAPVAPGAAGLAVRIGSVVGGR